MCHNDLYQLNILVDTINNKCHLIDLEYFGPGFLGLDLLNFYL